MSKIRIPYTLILPTYQRTLELDRCLNSIESLNYEFERINIVVRDSDFETRNFLSSRNIGYLVVDKPGLIAAMKKGIEFSDSDVIVFIDDDTEVNDNWIQSATKVFENPLVGAVGGRDMQPANPVPPNQNSVGKFKLRGKLVGNHHLYNGNPTHVDFLKGCNMFLRKSILNTNFEILDQLKGSGAQWGCDLVLSISSRLNGLKTVFDPNVSLIHHAAPRLSELRNPETKYEKIEISFNIWLIKMVFCYRFTLPIVIIFGLLVGDRANPGVLRSIALNRLSVHKIILDLSISIRAFLMVFPLVPKLRKPLPSHLIGNN